MISTEAYEALIEKAYNLQEENKRLRRLVQTLIDNDPNDMAGDAITVLDVWRKEAQKVLEDK